jgi:hypothetical protein
MLPRQLRRLLTSKLGAERTDLAQPNPDDPRRRRPPRNPTPEDFRLRTPTEVLDEYLATTARTVPSGQ